MQLNPRSILIGMIMSLLLLLLLWMDGLYMKTVGLFDWRYEVIKIVLHTGLAYKLSKFLIRRLGIDQRFESFNPSHLFLLIFMVLNGYIIGQYTSRVVSHRIINSKVRYVLYSKTERLPHAGWGYETKNMSSLEYEELIKDTGFPKVPKEAEAIDVYDWYEIDFSQSVTFDMPIDYDIEAFYHNDTLVLHDLIEEKYDIQTGMPYSANPDRIKRVRYKWEVSVY